MSSASLNEITDVCSRYPFIFKFIAANDTGITNSHQSGIYMMRSFWPLFLDREGHKGEKLDKKIEILWNNKITTESRFIWYGEKTRSEYRLTRGLTKIFKPEQIGSLFIIAKKDENEYLGYILESDDDIESFLSFFNLYSGKSGKNEQSGGLVYPDSGLQETPLEGCFEKEMTGIVFMLSESLAASGLPNTVAMSGYAREICSKCGYKGVPDDKLLKWRDTEFRLFRKLEEKTVMERLDRKFLSVDEFVSYANSVVNTRKSRSGFSLENHLSAIFDENKIPYSSNPVIEGKKRPDFLFPGVECYNDKSFPSDKLVFLGAKTTCKDRWRQVLNEADRIPEKHIFTLQEGISENQLDEMEEANVRLVIPEPYRGCYPKNYRDSLLSLNYFVEYLNDKIGDFIPAN